MQIKVNFEIFLKSALLETVLRIRDVYPGSQISDPKTATKEKGEKNMLSYLFL